MASNDAFIEPELVKTPAGVDRRAFLMRSATIGAAAVLTGCTAEEKAKQVDAVAQAAPLVNKPPDLSPALNVVKKQNGPVLKTLKVDCMDGPGRSRSNKLGPF